MKRFGHSMEREETRREHLSELRAFLGLMPFGLRQFQQFARWLAELAMQTDKGVVLATALIQEIRREKVVLPPINVIERVCALAITRANRKIISKRTVCRLMTIRLSTYRLSAGNTSISRATTSGARTDVWKAANLDLSDRFPFLNVRFFPFRDVQR
jgi:Domain of unknown function (DUF4158)